MPSLRARGHRIEPERAVGAAHDRIAATTALRAPVGSSAEHHLCTGDARAALVDDAARDRRARSQGELDLMVTGRDLQPLVGVSHPGRPRRDLIAY